MTMRASVTRRGTAIAVVDDMQIIAGRTRKETVAKRQSARIATRLEARFPPLFEALAVI